MGKSNTDTRRIPPMDGGSPPTEDEVSERLPNATLEECELQGEWAHSFGMKTDANPYVRSSAEYDAWVIGWYDGQDNDEG